MARPRRKPGSTAPGGSPRRGRRGKGPFTDAGKGRIGEQQGRPQWFQKQPLRAGSEHFADDLPLTAI